MEAFLVSFGIIFAAELGDKSQLMAMTFAARYRALTIVFAITRERMKMAFSNVKRDDIARRVLTIRRSIDKVTSGESVLFLLDEMGVCASAASACASGAMEPSHVLAAMGVPAARAGGALRLSLGHDTTDADIDAAVEAVTAAASRLLAGAAR